MSMRYPGGLIATSPVNAAYPSGVWTQAQAIPYQSQNVWTRDQYWPYTTLLLQGNGTNGAQNNTFLDSSTNNFTITRNGNTTQGSFTPYEANGYWSNYFNGSSSLSVNVSGVAAGTSTFTFEAWVYLNAYPGSDAPLYDTRSTNGASTTGMQFGVYSTGALKFYDGTETNLGGNVPLNQWVHIALVRNGSNVMTPYINGTATGTTVSSTRNFSDQYFWIGSVPGPASPYINAYLSNLRWVVGTAVYTSNFTPSASPLTAITNTKILTCQSNRFIDNSTNAFAITVNGSPSVQAFQPFPGQTTYSTSVLGGSGYFDGTGDYLTAPDNAAWDVGSGNFTIESWVYPTASPNQPIIVGQWTSSYSWVMLLSNDSNRYLRGIVYDGSFRDYISSTSLALNAWNHCAFVRESSTISLYLNGSRVYTTTYSGTVSTSTSAVSIGADSTGGSPFAGYLSSTRVVVGTALYSGTTYTVPTAPLTAVSNTQLLTNFTNAGISDAAMMNDLETVGNAQVSTSVVKYGTGSMAFDGSGDYLFAPSRATTSLEGDFTIEGWAYLSSTAAAWPVITIGDSSGASGIELYRATSNGKWRVYSSNTAQIDSSTSTSTGSWVHLAVVRSSGVVRLYVNGINEGSTWSTTSTFSGAVYVAAEFNGGSVTVSANGYIDDLRITKGAARYITNFTPPPARMPGQ